LPVFDAGKTPVPQPFKIPKRKSDMSGKSDMELCCAASKTAPANRVNLTPALPI
jgi:hypothetical protein